MGHVLGNGVFNRRDAKRTKCETRVRYCRFHARLGGFSQADGADPGVEFGAG